MMLSLPAGTMLEPPGPGRAPMDDESAEKSFKEPEAGPTWRERAQLGPLEAVLDPSSQAGRKNHLVDRIHKRALSRAVGNVEGAAVLDFGCGTGRLSDWLARHGARVEGVDATDEMVAAAKANVPEVHFQTIASTELPFADRQFDLVVTAYVLQYYVDPDASTVRELERVLAHGGKLVAIEQVADDELGRGGTVTAYDDMFRGAGLDLADIEMIRLSDSRIAAVAERLPALARIPWLPWLVAVETRSRKGVLLTDGRYADVVFCATKARA
jgi:SAM-dependent methyltransferase